MITFKDVIKNYKNDIVALNGISFDIKKGECVFLTGPSGSGKSTIIKMITGEELPTSGIVTVDNYEVEKLSNRKLSHYRRNIGVVYQDFRLIETKTIWDNMYCIMKGLGRSDKEMKKQIPNMLNSVGILNRKDNYPNELSGGEQQRLAIARALCSEPKIVIADEPTGNLDPENSLDIMKMLVKLNESGTTVLIVTHERELIKQFNKRTIHIKQGMIASDDEENEVEKHE